MLWLYLIFLASVILKASGDALKDGAKFAISTDTRYKLSATGHLLVAICIGLLVFATLMPSLGIDALRYHNLIWWLLFYVLIHFSLFNPVYNITRMLMPGSTITSIYYSGNTSVFDKFENSLTERFRIHPMYIFWIRVVGNFSHVMLVIQMFNS